jgi:hypothetical protein
MRLRLHLLTSGSSSLPHREAMTEIGNAAASQDLVRGRPDSWPGAEVAGLLDTAAPCFAR